MKITSFFSLYKNSHSLTFQRIIFSSFLLIIFSFLYHLFHLPYSLSLYNSAFLTVFNYFPYIYSHYHHYREKKTHYIPHLIIMAILISLISSYFVFINYFAFSIFPFIIYIIIYSTISLFPIHILSSSSLLYI